MKPVIYSSDRVDLDVELEVSSQAAGASGVGNNPGFNTNRLQTKLPLKDGEQILLGGLVEQTTTTAKNGIPFLKDIPVVGRAFSTTSDSKNDQELMILITPYIIGNEFDAQAITREFKNRLGPWVESKSLPPLRANTPIQVETPKPDSVNPTPVPAKP